MTAAQRRRCWRTTAARRRSNTRCSPALIATVIIGAVARSAALDGIYGEANTS